MRALVTLTMLLEYLLFLHADPHGLGKQDSAEELSKDQQCTWSEDIIDPFKV